MSKTPSQGKGSRSRVKDLKAYRRGWDRIFRPKPPRPIMEVPPLRVNDLEMPEIEPRDIADPVYWDDLT